MVPVLGKPLLEWHVEQYKKHGVKEFIFALGYLPHTIRDHFGDGARFGVSIAYTIEKTPLGSFGYMRDVRALQDRFYFNYGDVFSLVDYGAVARTYAAKASPVGMERVGRPGDGGDASCAVLDSEYRFVAVHERPGMGGDETGRPMRGSFILEKEILSYIPEGTANFSTDVLPRVIGAGKNFYGYECDDYSKGIDTLEKLREVENYLRANTIGPWW